MRLGGAFAYWGGDWGSLPTGGKTRASLPQYHAVVVSKRRNGASPYMYPVATLADALAFVATLIVRKTLGGIPLPLSLAYWPIRHSEVFHRA